MLPSKIKSEINPSTVNEILDWAINIIVDNDIDSYDGDQMNRAVALANMLRQPIAYLKNIGTEEDPQMVLCNATADGAFPVYATTE